MVDMKVAGCKVEVSKSKIKILKLDVFHSSRWHIFYVTITYLDLNKGGEPRSTWSVASTLQCCHHQVLVIEVGCYIMFFFLFFTHNISHIISQKRTTRLGHPKIDSTEHTSGSRDLAGVSSQGVPLGFWCPGAPRDDCCRVPSHVENVMNHKPYPLVMTVTVRELEHGPVEIVDVFLLNMVIFHSFWSTLTRG